MLALLDVLLVVRLIDLYLILKDVEEQHGRCLLDELEHLKTLVEGAHRQLCLVVFDKRNAHLE